ncbi:SH3 and PX domain-containing protein 2B [Bulinus truncatus]|nr:SH3 and PX domain-containing protein 2B [Bulinus truncatus]
MEVLRRTCSPKYLKRNFRHLSKLKISKDKKAEQISAPKRFEGFVAVADYTAQSAGELTLNPGLKVEVLEKNDNGWWFVHSEDAQGWVPSTYLEPEAGADPSALQGPVAAPGKEESYICIERFSAQSADEVSLEKGAVVQVLQKNMDGWWLVRYSGKEGYAPGTVLKKVSSPRIVSMVEKSNLSGVEIISSLHDVSNLLNQNSKTEVQHDIKGSPKLAKEDLTKRASVIVKQRSLERGGNLIPPPRKNSVNKMGSPTSPTKSNVYVTISDFTDTVGDGISFKKGQKVFVTEKSNTGWWYVKMGDKEGWVVSTYLEPYADSITSSSVYEMADEIDAAGNDYNEYDDEEWYVEPEDDGETVFVQSSIDTANRPLPAVPPIETSKTSKPLPSLPTKPGGCKLSDPAKSSNSSSDTPKLTDKKVARATSAQLNVKPLDVVLKPVVKPPDPPSKLGVVKPPLKPAVPSELPKKTADNECHPSGSSVDFASQLKAKFESRLADAVPEAPDNSAPKPAPVKFGGPQLPTGKPMLPQKEIDLPKSNQTVKPPPPSKSKPSPNPSSVALKPTSQPGTKPTLPSVKPNPSTVKPNPPAPASKTGLKAESNNNYISEKDSKKALPEKNNVKSLSSTFDASSNRETASEKSQSSVVKPVLPGKPKPALPAKSSNQSSGEQRSGSQNVNSLVNNLNGKLNFGQNQIPSKAANVEIKPPPVPKMSAKMGAVTAPATNSARLTSPMASTYIAVSTFVAENEGELGFSEGDEVEVLEEQSDWCRIRFWDEEGWAPTSYLQKL